MKIGKLALAVLLSGACVLSAQAQKLVKYLPESRSATKMIPYVVNPKLPAAVRANFAVPVVRANVNLTLERQVLQAATQAQTVAQLPQTKDFLTGPQALRTLRPGWKSELSLSGFTRQQLDLIEQAFKETDQFLFETNKAGTWLKPRSREWNYLARFAQILTDYASGELTFSDGQIKTLFGKFSRLDDVFTRLNLQSFLLTHEGRAPKASTPGEEGKLARKVKYNLDKRNGNKMNPEVEGYVYGKMPAKLQTPPPSYGPKTISARRTSQQVWEEITQFIKEKGYFPSRQAQGDEERSLRMAFDNKIRRFKYLNDPALMRLIALKEKWLEAKTDARTPQQVLTQVEQFIDENHRFPSQHAGNPTEISLRRAFNNAVKFAKSPNDPVIVRLTTLKNQWVQNRAENKTPQQVLKEVEQFIEETGHFPSETAGDVTESLLRKVFDGAIRRAKNPDDPVVGQLTALKEQWVRKTAEFKTTQQVLKEVEQFIKQHGYFPSETVKSSTERSLRRIINSAISRANNPHAPVIMRLMALKKQWGKKYAVRKTPQEWLAIVEPWVQEHQRWPSFAIAQERTLYNGTHKAIYRNPDDPASVRLKELKNKYLKNKSCFVK